MHVKSLLLIIAIAILVAANSLWALAENEGSPGHGEEARMRTVQDAAITLKVYAPTVGKNFSLYLAPDGATAVTGGPMSSKLVVHLKDGYLLDKEDQVAFFGGNSDLLFAPAKELLLFSRKEEKPARWYYVPGNGVLYLENGDIYECPTGDREQAPLL
jgi:hypothetical protein